MTAPGDPLAAGRRAHAAGRLDEAEQRYRACLDQPRVAAPAALLLAQLLGDTGRFDEAEALLRPMLGTGGAPVRLLHARLLAATGRWSEVLADLESVFDEPRLAGDARLLAAEALEALGRRDEAARQLAIGVEAAPGHPVLWNRLGVRRHGEGNPDAAVGCFERSLDLRPTHSGVRGNLAAALLDAGQVDRAEQLFREVLADDAADRRAGLGYVRLLKESGRLDEALELASRLAGAHRDDPDVLAARASVAQAAGDVTTAERDFGQAQAIDPTHAGARAGRAELMDWAGRYADGLDSLGPAAPDEPAPLRLMRARLLGRLGHDAEALGSLAGLDAAGLADVGLRRRLAFLEGELLERLGRYEEALTCYGRGNRLNPAAWRPEPPEATVPPAPAGHDGGAGVALIVGMPRSGTTLLEHMLAGHPQVIAGGERAELGLLARDPAVRTRELTAAEAESLAARYLRDPIPGGRVFTDKMPLNYLHLPVAARLLPRARVLHCIRDARDVAVSCFSQDFIDPALAFARRWDWLASVLTDYRERMTRWAASPGLPTHTVRYESLVEDPASEIGGVLDFLGLSWDPACLEASAARTAHTASHAQVRRPVYTTSVGRWRRFEPWLPPDVIAL